VADKNKFFESTGYNYIINGDQNVWQENTTFTSDTADNWLSDQWEHQFVSTDNLAVTGSRDTSVPSLAEGQKVYNYSLKLAVTTAETATATDEAYYLRQSIEGYEANQLINQEVTLSFWVRASDSDLRSNAGPSTYCISAQNIGDGTTADRSFIHEYTINDPDTWEYKTITFTVDDQTSGTWNNTNDVGLSIAWPLLLGSDFYNVGKTWLGVNDFGTLNSNTVWGTTTSDTFYITGVELALGKVAGKTVVRSFGEEVAKCQRYFSKTWNYEDVVGTATTRGILVGVSSNTANSGVIFNWSFPVSMRKQVSTITAYNPVTSATGSCRRSTTDIDCTGKLTSNAHGYFSNDETTTDGAFHHVHGVGETRLGI